ncbi:hypothetical protein FLM44_03030 [Pseudoalteromonas luteoviolacea]|nr:hypothetical protein FLM44_03030 [Pseudoalteromonas luteoviolacea]
MRYLPLLFLYSLRSLLCQKAAIKPLYYRTGNCNLAVTTLCIKQEQITNSPTLRTLL